MKDTLVTSDLKDDLAASGFAVRNGLVLYYPFNETDGSVTEDYTTDLRHGLVIRRRPFRTWEIFLRNWF